MIANLQKNQLKQAAIEALQRPFPLDAKRVYAAAVLTTHDNIFSSAQFFSDTLSLTLHAEQSAIAHAAAHGEGLIKAIACTSNNEYAYPCHMCKQLLWENHLRSGEEIETIVFNDEKEEIIDLTKMITFPWPAPK